MAKEKNKMKSLKFIVITLISFLSQIAKKNIGLLQAVTPIEDLCERLYVIRIRCRQTIQILV